MDGYIKISAKNEEDGNRITIETRMNHVDIADKVALLDAFTQAIELNEMSEILAAVMCIPVAREGQESIKFDPRVFEGRV